jgi:hypothetical protein
MSYIPSRAHAATLALLGLASGPGVSAAKVRLQLEEEARRSRRCPYLGDGEILVVIYADEIGRMSVEAGDDPHWPWMVENDVDVLACFALRIDPHTTRDLLGTLRLSQAAYRDAEPIEPDDATIAAVRASVRAGV